MEMQEDGARLNEDFKRMEENFNVRKKQIEGIKQDSETMVEKLVVEVSVY